MFRLTCTELLALLPTTTGAWFCWQLSEEGFAFLHVPFAFERTVIMPLRRHAVEGLDFVCFEAKGTRQVPFSLTSLLWEMLFFKESAFWIEAFCLWLWSEVFRPSILFDLDLGDGGGVRPTFNSEFGTVFELTSTESIRRSTLESIALDNEISLSCWEHPVRRESFFSAGSIFFSPASLPGGISNFLDEFIFSIGTEFSSDECKEAVEVATDPEMMVGWTRVSKRKLLINKL